MDRPLRPVLNPIPVYPTINEDLNTQNWTPLHLAVYKQDIVQTQLILTTSFDVNTADLYRRTPLSIAAFHGNLSLIKLLIVNGARITDGFPLHYSCLNNQQSAMEFFLQNGADVNAALNGIYPIMLTVMYQNVHSTRLLIDYGADLRVHCTRYGSLLARAITMHETNLELANLLIQFGVDVNHNEHGLPPFQILTNPAMMELFVNNGAVMTSGCSRSIVLEEGQRWSDEFIGKMIHFGLNLNVQDSSGETALLKCVIAKRWDDMNILLKYGASPNIVNNHGWSPLHVAALDGNMHVVRMLIDCGANVNQATVHGLIPMHLAAAGGHLQVVTKLFFYGSCINVRCVGRFDDKDFKYMPTPVKNAWIKPDYTPLLLATLEKRAAVVLFLLSCGAEIVYLPRLNVRVYVYIYLLKHLLEADVGGRGSCKCCSSQVGIIGLVRNQNVEIIRRLSVIADLNSPDLAGRTALHHAVLISNEAIARELLAKGADPNILDWFGCTALSLAAFKNQLNILKLLLSHKADIKLGYPMHYAARSGAEECLVELIKSNGSVEGEDLMKETPLFVAIEHKNTSCVKILLEHGVDPNYRSTSGRTALCNSCIHGNYESAELLIQRGAHVNMRDETSHETPLILALCNREYAIFKLLLQHGADIHATDEDGWNALHFSCLLGTETTVLQLIQAGARLNARTAYKEFPLLLSTENSEIMELLLQNNADVNASWDCGTTALHRSARYNKIQNVRLLLRYNANVNAVTARNSLPIHEAAAKGHTSIVKILLDHGSYVDLPIYDISACTLSFNPIIHSSQGNTPLIEAAKKGRYETVKLLIEYGSSVNWTNAVGNSALHEAILHKQNEIATLLLASGADPTLKRKSRIFKTN